MNRFQIEYAARLSVFELLLRNLLANTFSHQPEEKVEKIIGFYSNLAKTLTFPNYTDQLIAEKHGMEIAQLAAKVMDDFLEQVDKEQKDIREGQAVKLD